jgi:hypothetical protein
LSRPNPFGGLFKRSVLVVRTEAGLKIDWEASGDRPCNPMTLDAYQAQMPTSSVVMKVWVTLDDDYNYDFHNARNTHWSLNITTTMLTGVHAFVAKDSELGRRLFARLSDGAKKQMTLEISYASRHAMYATEEEPILGGTRSSAVRGSRIVDIERVVSLETWDGE